MITYGRGALLWDPAVNSIAQLVPATVTIAHELAHQWFGNLVTAAWWSNLWLNEGFATFVEYIGAEYTDGALRIADTFVSEAQAEALRYDSGPRSHAIITDDRPAGAFDSISYAKGGSVIRMMEGVLTRPVFLAGIKQYLLGKTYQNAVAGDLFGYLDAASAAAGKHVNVTSFMAQWTQRAGYPLLTCRTYESDGNTRWSCRQARFFTYTNPPADSTLWQIPLTGSSSRGPAAEDFGLTGEREFDFQQPAGTSWLKLNGNSTGFYRVMYDQPTWHRLGDALNAPGFSAMYHDDRLNIVSDVYTFADQSLLSYAQVLNISLFLQHDNSFTVWQVAHPLLEQLYNRLRYTKAGGQMEEYMRQALSAAAADVQVLNTTRATPAEELLINIIGSSIIRFNAAGKRQQLQQRYLAFQQGWPNDALTDLDPSQVYLVLQAGVAEGSIDDWRWVYTNVWLQKTLNPADDPVPALDLYDTLAVLASPRQPAVILHVLNTLNATISQSTLFDDQSTLLLLVLLADNDIGLPVYNDWVVLPGVLQSLNGTLSAGSMRQLISATLALNSDAQTVDRLANAYTGAQLGYDVQNAIAQGRQQATRNADWLAIHYQPLEAYLLSEQWRRRDSSSTGTAWH